MGDVHLNTQKDSREFSVKYPIPTPRELDVIPDEYYDENYQKRFDELDYKEEIDISCDLIPLRIWIPLMTRKGTFPPFEEPTDDGLFPLPEVDILPIKVEPVEVMCNDSHTYGENFSQVEREFLSMVDEFLNLSNDDETFDSEGGRGKCCFA
ncbi:hypothetical protein Tco_1327501 [Tanacetum coccineum]